MGAKAVVEEAFGILYKVLRHPIEVEESNDRFTHRPFIEQRQLFWPEAYLGYADPPIRYLSDLWTARSHLHQFFESEEDYQFAVAQFLMVVALADAAAEDQERPLYPGYRLMTQRPTLRAMSQLCGRLARIQEYRDGIARAVMNEQGSVLRQKWATLVEYANNPELGSRYFPGLGVRFPNPMDGQIREGW
jgi:hypothetical protein